MVNAVLNNNYSPAMSAYPNMLNGMIDFITTCIKHFLLFFLVFLFVCRMLFFSFFEKCEFAWEKKMKKKTKKCLYFALAISLNSRIAVLKVYQGSHTFIQQFTDSQDRSIIANKIQSQLTQNAGTSATYNQEFTEIAAAFDALNSTNDKWIINLFYGTDMTVACTEHQLELSSRFNPCNFFFFYFFFYFLWQTK